MTIFDTDKYKNAELKTYQSVSALCDATGLDKKLVKLAKKRNTVGFNNNQSVNWKLLRPAFEEMYNDLVEISTDDIAYWKKEIAKKDVSLKELQIRKLEKDMLEPEEVKNLIVELATKQSVVLKRVFLELPPKLAGKSEQEIKLTLDKSLEDIFTVLQGKIDRWK